MDFFQAQETSRRKSKLLVFYFVCAVVLIVCVVYLAALMAFGRQGVGFDLWKPDLFAFSAAGTLALIAGGSFFKTLSLRSGGGAVARSLGGTLVPPDTTDPRLRRLQNIVEEMAIASGTRVPQVYLLPEAGINAFAAGFSPDDAAVAVTAGALDNLSRDELQGVIAHEFSHILNGDMRLNIRLIGLLFGILLLAVIGRGVFHSMRFSRVASGGRNRNSGGAVAAMLLLGLALIIVGYVGVLFGRLIQAAVSRQREFLADASAVQFTRNPHGIAGALKKIGGLAAGSSVTNTHAAETSHMFFANALRGSAFNLFATHPPLVERIQAIEPSFDGDFKAVTLKPPVEALGAERSVGAGRKRSTPPPLRPELFVSQLAGMESAEAGAAAESLFASIPPNLRASAHDPRHVRPLLLALLVARDDEASASAQREALRSALTPEEQTALPDLVSATAGLPASARLPLVDLALPTIRSFPAEQITAFLQAVRQLIEADERTTLFEFALLQVAERYLRPTRTTAGPGSHIVSFRALTGEFSAVLSLIVHAGSGDPAQVQQAFNAGAAQLSSVRDRLALQPRGRISLSEFHRGLRQLERAAPPIKLQLLKAMAHAAAADGVIMPAEAETLRATAAAIDCPAPPIGRE